MDAANPAPGYQRILVIKLRHLGDVLLSTPVFAALRDNFPRAEIIACVNPGTSQMLEGNPHVQAVFTPPAAQGNRLKRWKRELDFARQVRAARFDLVIDLTTSDRSALLTRVSGAKTRLGYRSLKGFAGRGRCYTTEVQPQRNEHVVLKHLRILNALGIEARTPLVFPVSEAERAVVRPLLPSQPFFQVHPVSRIAKKNWPVEYMAQAVNSIAERGWVPVITGSNDPAEKAWIGDLCARLRGTHLDLSGRLSLKQLGALSERAQCFLGVDTAPMHIAAAVGAPVIALFGPSSELLWGPWCEKKLVLSRDLECRLPCKNKLSCQTIHCLREFTPAMIQPKLEAFLREIVETTDRPDQHG